MNKIEHIGIAVKNIEESNILFTKILGRKPYKSEQVDLEKIVKEFIILQLM